MGKFQKGNKAAFKHGGETAVVAIRRGYPLTGEALDAYQAILDELGIDLDGLDDKGRLLVMAMAREGAAAELYWRAFCAAVDAGDGDAMNRYVDRWGWLAGRFGRMLDKLVKGGYG